MKIVGQKELKEKLKKTKKTVINDIEQALVTSALIVERDAKINTPVDTGRLRSSISHDSKNFGSNNPSVTVGTNVDYAKHVEFGMNSAA